MSVCGDIMQRIVSVTMFSLKTKIFKTTKSFHDIVPVWTKAMSQVLTHEEKMKWLLNNVGLENLTDIKFSMAKFGSISISIGSHNSHRWAR